MSSSPVLSLQLMPAIRAVGLYQSVASNHPYRAVILAALLLGDVNFFFLVHVAQEQQQRAGTEDDGQPERYPAVHVPSRRGVVGYELVELKNRTTQSGQTYNGQQKVNHNQPPAFAKLFE